MSGAPELVPIDRSVWIDAPPHVVFEYFTRPELMVRWSGRRAELDPRPGGIYRVEYGAGWVASGTFQEVDPPRRLVYTLGWEGSDETPPGSTRVHVAFEAVDNGTAVRVLHYGPPSAGRESDGWARYLSRLAAAAEGRDPGIDPFDDIAAAP